MTLLELETAADALPNNKKRHLVQFLLSRLNEQPATQLQPEKRHSVLDIPTVSLGECYKPLSSDDDLLGEMLEGRS